MTETDQPETRDPPAGDQLQTSPALAADLRSLLRGMSPEQKRFISKRPWCNSNREAAELAEVPIDTVNGWRKRGIPIDKAVGLLADDGVIMADEILRDGLATAAHVKVAGLESEDERIQQQASTEILDRKLGKATQYIDSKTEVEAGERLAEMLAEIQGIPYEMADDSA